MSDGPHKSLPMRRHWKKLAERAAVSVYSQSDVAEALSVALKKDFEVALILQLQEIYRGGNQMLLFNEDCRDQLEAARRGCPGSVAGNILIDCAVEADAEGLRGDVALNTALNNALDAYAQGVFRQIEEHYRRKEFRSITNMKGRLKSALSQCSPGSLASEMISARTAGVSIPYLPKRIGLDEGPSL